VILLPRVGSPPDNGISIRLQEERIKNRNQCSPNHDDLLRFVGELRILYANVSF
jgi:hypothetical protein